jgi:phosphoenolpyruvate---glycerone phosphotransferase subunit DhaL
VSGSTARRGGVGSIPKGGFAVDAAFVRRWVGEIAGRIEEQRDFLTELDSAIGDADHGINMDRGASAAVATALSADGSPGDILVEVGTTLVYRVGGAAGPLFGTGFRELGAAITAAPRLDAEALLAGLRAGLEGIQRLGAAVIGDKTIVDAWTPAAAAFERELRAGETPDVAARNAAEAAMAGAIETISMQARKGRASYLGARSVGHQDPGATSTALIFAALERTLRRSA